VVSLIRLVLFCSHFEVMIDEYINECFSMHLK
jgi:hypothetical protein